MKRALEAEPAVSAKESVHYSSRSAMGQDKPSDASHKHRGEHYEEHEDKDGGGDRRIDHDDDDNDDDDDGDDADDDDDDDGSFPDDFPEAEDEEPPNSIHAVPHVTGSSSALAEDFAQGGSSTATRLLMKEFMQLRRLQQAGQSEGVHVELPDEANLYRWFVLMTPPQDSALAEQLAAFAKAHKEPSAVQMELLFTQNYPVEPPFVRIIKPRFAFHTGHITVGGSVCLELLTSSGWSPAYSIESLLVQIRSLILTGDGRVDQARPNVQYDEKEAREAFLRVARQHGWMN
mmetsp:Transcript_9349/g.15556  ORF Transcript_9349/g.15556 Transcript_9349/m.15556 type:complete len:289 (-) Transcript_9349:415-1281(-)